MDAIFRKTSSIFSAVKVAREEPRRHGKHGELLIRYEDTEEHAIRMRRASSTGEKGIPKRAEQIENGDVERSGGKYN